MGGMGEDGLNGGGWVGWGRMGGMGEDGWGGEGWVKNEWKTDEKKDENMKIKILFI